MCYFTYHKKIPQTHIEGVLIYSYVISILYQEKEKKNRKRSGHNLFKKKRQRKEAKLYMLICSQCLNS